MKVKEIRKLANDWFYNEVVMSDMKKIDELVNDFILLANELVNKTVEQ
ncbi:MAG: hypothetical protein OEY49_18710 [Candidatus Heimdallarchaeota archaeon]|nr:hypothetical protein [Candidatus Heimdallarchaeota archaeon]